MILKLRKVNRAACILIICCVFAFQSGFAKCIPISKGNNWTYDYSLRKHSLSFGPFDSIKTGILILTIDSVATTIDSIDFRLACRDSGKLVWFYPGSDTIGIEYDTSYNKKLTIRNGIVLDTEASIPFKVNLISLITYSIAKDTSYSINGGMATQTYNRHTDSSVVVVNGTSSNMYTTISLFFTGDRYLSTTKSDTVSWIDSFGSMSTNKYFSIHHNPGPDYGYEYTESIRLILYNSKPINVSASIHTPVIKDHLRKNDGSIYGKFVWLDRMSYLKDNVSVNYYDLQGVKVGLSKLHQFVVYKKTSRY